MESALEFLTTRKSGGEVIGIGLAVKVQIVSESLRPGAKVNVVTERLGLRSNSVSTWRAMAQQGKLYLPATEHEMEFAAVVVDPPVMEPPTNITSRPEIIVGSVTIRLEEGVSAAYIAAVARACGVPA